MSLLNIVNQYMREAENEIKWFITEWYYLNVLVCFIICVIFYLTNKYLRISLLYIAFSSTHTEHCDT